MPKEQSEDTGVSVTVSHTFTRNTVEDWLICAFEGGSNYWIDQVRLKSDDDDRDVYRSAFDSGVLITVSAEHGDPNSGQDFLLAPESIQRGTQAMADNAPSHFADFIDENYDATTSDVWLQYCLFGKVIYG